MSPRKESFEHFYLTKVALGDCCGCAERVIDWRDIELARARYQLQPLTVKSSIWSRIKRTFRRPNPSTSQFKN